MILLQETWFQWGFKPHGLGVRGFRVDLAEASGGVQMERLPSKFQRVLGVSSPGSMLEFFNDFNPLGIF